MTTTAPGAVRRAATVPTLLAVCMLTATTRAASRFAAGDRRGDDGQATAEYALVLLGAAAIAMAIVSWVSKANPIGGLFDFVFDKVLGKVL